jgi:hypothetical protein
MQAIPKPKSPKLPPESNFRRCVRRADASHLLALRELSSWFASRPAHAARATPELIMFLNADLAVCSAAISSLS